MRRQGGSSLYGYIIYFMIPLLTPSPGTCDTAWTVWQAVAIPLSKFRLFGLGRVSRVEWRAPRPVERLRESHKSHKSHLLEASHFFWPLIDNATPPPHFEAAHQERHSHYASDDFTPAVSSAVVLCLFKCYHHITVFLTFLQPSA